MDLLRGLGLYAHVSREQWGAALVRCIWSDRGHAAVQKACEPIVCKVCVLRAVKNTGGFGKGIRMAVSSAQGAFAQNRQGHIQDRPEPAAQVKK